MTWNFDCRSTDGKRYRFVPGVSGLHRRELPCLVISRKTAIPQSISLAVLSTFHSHPQFPTPIHSFVLFSRHDIDNPSP